MHNIKNTKGNVDVISIVLLSMIAIMIITLIYPSIKEMIESSTQATKSCEDILEEQSISMIPSCYNQLTNNIEINITKFQQKSSTISPNQ